MKIFIHINIRCPCAVVILYRWALWGSITYFTPQYQHTDKKQTPRVTILMYRISKSKRHMASINIVYSQVIRLREELVWSSRSFRVWVGLTATKRSWLKIDAWFQTSFFFTGTLWVDQYYVFNISWNSCATISVLNSPHRVITICFVVYSLGSDILQIPA